MRGVGVEEDGEAGDGGDKSAGRWISYFWYCAEGIWVVRSCIKVANPTHMIPCRKVAVSATFCWVSSSSCQTSGIGITSMMNPSTTLGIVMKRAKARMLMHLPPSRVLSHPYATGEHWKMVVRVFAIPDPITTTALRMRTIVKPRLCVVKTRR